MNYIFFGTPDFAAIILKKLIEANMVPAAVVTNPDRPAGRKKIITAPPVKRENETIKIFQPEEINETFIDEIKTCHAEIGVLAAYGKIVPKKLIEAFPKGIVGVHPSLLPKYRGATPIQSTLLAGEQETGTTLFLLDEKVDHGLMLESRKQKIENSDTYETLSKKLAELSADLLIATLPRYLKGKVVPEKQDESRTTYTKKITTEDALVSLDKDDPKIIWRKVRALNPEPGVWTIKNGKRMKILEADFKDGKLILKKIQWEGEKPKPCI